MKNITIIVPVFNESEVIPEFSRVTKEILTKSSGRYRFEFLFIDDGSTDSTNEQLVECFRDEAFRILKLSRNFGKEAALSAGIDNATGDAAIIMDVDLQDPPEIIDQFLEQWQHGYQVVYGVRGVRKEDSLTKRISAGWFYRIFNLMSDIQIPEHAGDFRLLDRSVILALQQLPERTRFTKGLYAWAGFHAIGIAYERPSRKKGKTKWSYWKLWNLALDGIFSFSDKPLRIFTYLGAGISLASLVYAMNTVIKTFFLGIETKGYASIITAVTFLGGLQLLFLGIMSEYIGRVFTESKNRPRYLIMGEINSNAQESGHKDK
jgi:polyisoprenyl-phosphate glycosyltransferase